MRALVVMDLDGTLYRGSAPYRYYAELVSRSLPPDERERYLLALERFLAGEQPAAAADGWEAATVLAGGTTGGAAVFREEFLQARAFMLGAGCELEIPKGMTTFLERARTVGRLVVATNTPGPYVFPLLERLGLGTYFDEVCCMAEKPGRFRSWLGAWAKLYGIPAWAVLSVGDHFANDIAPALEGGCAAGYLDPFKVGPRGLATFEGPDFETLRAPLMEWLESMAKTRPPALTP